MEFLGIVLYRELFYPKEKLGQIALWILENLVQSKHH